MPYDSKAIANYFLDLAERDGTKLDPMKSQKLVYFAHGWNLAIDNTALIDDTVEAWQYGPVIPTLYHEFKHYGRGLIQRKACSIDFLDDTRVVMTTPTVPEEDCTTRALLDRIWQVYGELTGVQLSNMTHEVGSPWDVTWKEAGGRKNVDIPDARIRDFFARLMNAPA